MKSRFRTVRELIDELITAYQPRVPRKGETPEEYQQFVGKASLLAQIMKDEGVELTWQVTDESPTRTSS